jgi:predicted transcriptional regulator
MSDPCSLAAYADSAPHHQSDRDEILSILKAREDLTSDEYAQRTGRGINAVSGRFSELRDSGLIVPSGKRRPTRTGSSAKAWKLAPKSGELF